MKVRTVIDASPEWQRCFEEQEAERAKEGLRAEVVRRARQRGRGHREPTKGRPPCLCAPYHRMPSYVLARDRAA